MTRRFTGWHMTAILLAFFGVVIAVNLVMATFAMRTFGGTVVDNSYVASQKYNDWLAAARAQQQLGWRSVVKLDADRRVTISVLAADTPLAAAQVTGFARHPLGRAADIPLVLVEAGQGQFRSAKPLAAGRWHIHLTVRQGANEARLIETLS